MLRRKKNKSRKEKKQLTLLAIVTALSVGLVTLIILNQNFDREGFKVADNRKTDIKMVKKIKEQATTKKKESSTNGEQSAVNIEESVPSVDDIPKTVNEVTSEPPGEYAPWRTKRNDGRKVAYLTFDDGPSVNTTSILRILDENKIKATFFIIGQNAERNADLVKREAADGHTIGNHTYSHEISYRESPQNFMKDVDRCNVVLRNILGDTYNSKLMRFPGGSFGHRLDPFKAEVTKNGYTYVDWNDETGDAEAYNPTVPVLMNNLRRYTGAESVVVLMHDATAKKNTVQALPQVIQYLKDNGYSFDVI